MEDNGYVIQSDELAELDGLNIDIEEFNKILNLIRNTFIKNKFALDDMGIYYERKQNGTSILAIKVTSGDDNDMKNYMINGSSAYVSGDKVFCDVYLHANAKSAKRANLLAGLISRDIVKFFQNVEQDLYIKGLFDSEYSLFVPLNNEIEVEKEKNSIKRLMKKFLNKKTNNV